MRRLLWILCFCVCIFPAGAVQITEFCPDPYLAEDTDEYLVLAGDGSLDGITVSDGKEGFRFPSGSSIHGTVTVARESAAFRASHGYLPDYELVDISDVPDVVNGKTLRMANTRDCLMVYENGNLIQKVSWPEDVKPREGQVHYLQDGIWDPRPLMIGQSRFFPASFDNVTVTTFVSPDCSQNVFTSVVAGARSDLLVNVYEFTSTDMSDALIFARENGTRVTVLLEGGPVGGISPGEKSAIWRMNQSGIPVYQMGAATGEHAPYRYDHAKYVVVDNRAVLLTSENFKNSGFPPAGTSGNRGWGVYMEDPRLAAYFSTVYASDLAGPAIHPIAGTDGPTETTTRAAYTQKFTPAVFSGAIVTPVISPDTSDQIIHMIDSAQGTIEIEQAYITNESKTRLNPYLAAAVNASRRGVSVRVLLDSYWFNTEDEADNDEMAALINHIASTENLPLEARCADLDASGIEKIHNKGVIVDDRAVLVSSINWNTNSPNFNREAGVIIEHPGAAKYFREVFDDDWRPAVRSSQPSLDYLKIACVIVVIGLLLILYYRRHVR
ncbi:MAG: phospholipase D-like domain-containing protein [Methanoregula sp.]|nr:phospholipase D-like domain-containing protein [Methanoregula sp.]